MKPEPMSDEQVDSIVCRSSKRDSSHDDCQRTAQAIIAARDKQWQELLESQEPVAYFNPQERKPFYWAKPTVINAPLTVLLPPMALYTAAGAKEKTE